MKYLWETGLLKNAVTTLITMFLSFIDSYVILLCHSPLAAMSYKRTNINLMKKMSAKFLFFEKGDDEC